MYVVICPHCDCATEIYFDLVVFDSTGWPTIRCQLCNGMIEPYIDELQEVPVVTQAS